MFPPYYTEKGPDYSVASQKKFRLWLAEKYKTDEALRKAWGSSTVTLTSAAIPRPDKDRFPLKSVSTGAPIKTFYNIPSEQAWVDYSDYYSDLVATRVIDWARTVKKASGGRKLNMFCQGYILEIGTSFGGHYALDKVLSCPEVDVLMSPVSYAVRQLGEPAGFMSPGRFHQRARQTLAQRRRLAYGLHRQELRQPRMVRPFGLRLPRQRPP